MTLEEIANEDAVAASVWGVFTLWSGFKFTVLAIADPSALTLISPLVGTICGAIIGYRHVQNLAAISREKIRAHKEVELAKIAANQVAIEASSKFALDPRCAKPNDDTVDVK